jgi:hypothetical protein
LRDLAERHGYEIHEKLDGGGQGLVYRAYDRRRRETVALKTMRFVDAARLKDFRREFLLAADLRHRNLVRLYDLISDGEVWFFTMELVQGSHFQAYVCAGARDTPQPDTVPWPPRDAGEGAAGPGVTAPPGLSAAEASRLRRALLQLAQGVHHLHQAGKLHRDLKDNNVLVTADGQVKVLDYGLMVESDEQATQEFIQGTYAYMAPELAEPRSASPASDWYSVGVMLYHALTGRLPFRADNHCRVLFHDKKTTEPGPPRELVPGAPEDLNSLCVDLLRRAPGDRPSGEEVLRRLGNVREGPPARPLPTRFVGRDAQLGQLREAYAAVRAGRTVQALVHGRSGMGKSALLGHFLRDVRNGGGEAVVLAGRCNECVVAPYEALNSLVDALTHHLRKPGVGVRAEALLPRDLGPLRRLFPVLEGVEAVASAPRGPEDATDPQELRRRAFAAFRELLQRLGDRRPLVLALDDLQWADLDSALLLNALLRPPDTPRLLLLGCYRTEDAARSPFLREFLSPSDPRIDRRTVGLEALTADEATDLAAQLLREGGMTDAVRAADCARESQGVPVFLQQLVQHAPPDGGAVTFESILTARVRALPGAGRRVLETVAVAARPLPLEDLFEVAPQDGADGRTLEHHLDHLLADRLVCRTGSARAPQIEIYHDRVRETVLAGLSAGELRQHHGRLARALRRGRPHGAREEDAEALAVHLEGAGEGAEASRYFGEAAAGAARRLAFDRAAGLYRRALRLAPADEAGQRPLHEQLGDALANAGRGAEAAEAYLKAAEGAEVGKSRDLRRRAAEQYLRSGHVEEGLRVLDEVLREVGLRLPRTPRAALWSWLLRCAWLRLRGLRSCRREERELTPERLQRVDLCRSAAVGLGMIDPVQSAYFQVRNVLLALRAGEPGRIALALANQALLCALFGGGGRRYVRKLLRAARALTHPTRDPLAWANTVLCRGGVALVEGRDLTAIRVSDRAERLLRDRCTGVAWERSTAQVFSLSSRLLVGQYREYGQRLPQLLEEAEARGDLYAATHVRCRSFEVWLSRDQPGLALQEIQRAMAEWPRHGFHLQHYWFLAGQVEIALYRGAGPQAWELVTRQAEGLRRSLLLRTHVLLQDWLYVRARSALAAAVAAGTGSPQEARALLREAEGAARRLERIKAPQAPGMGKLVRAGVAAAEGRTKVAVRLLTEAEQGLHAAGMATLLAVARCRRAQLCGLKDLYDGTIAWMKEQTIQNPEAILTMLAPGYKNPCSVGG